MTDDELEKISERYSTTCSCSACKDVLALLKHVDALKKSAAEGVCTCDTQSRVVIRRRDGTRCCSVCFKPLPAKREESIVVAIDYPIVHLASALGSVTLTDGSVWSYKPATPTQRAHWLSGADHPDGRWPHESTVPYRYHDHAALSYNDDAACDAARHLAVFWSRTPDNTTKADDDDSNNTLIDGSSICACYTPPGEIRHTYCRHDYRQYCRRCNKPVLA